MTKPKRKKFRVYFEQINATYIDVEADDKYDAIEKAGRKWRKGYAWPVTRGGQSSVVDLAEDES